MITPSLDPPAASVQMEGSLEPVAPQKLKAHRDKAFQQQTKGDDKTICTVRPEETVPHQAAALFGMEHVARNQVLNDHYVLHGFGVDQLFRLFHPFST